MTAGRRGGYCRSATGSKFPSADGVHEVERGGGGYEHHHESGTGSANRARGDVRGRAGRSRGPRLRGGAQGLQRDDRPPARADRALRERRGRGGDDRLRAPPRPPARRARRRPQRRRPWDLRRRRRPRPVAAECGRGRSEPARRGSAAAAPGAQVDAATHEHGLATPIGIISHARASAASPWAAASATCHASYGLTIDNLLEADVVLADGTQARASAEENPELFWALRGGGGNFGVVTSFQLQGAPGLHRARRTDVLAAGADRRGDAVLPRVPARGAPRAQRILRVA